MCGKLVAVGSQLGTPNLFLAVAFGLVQEESSVACQANNSSTSLVCCATKVVNMASVRSRHQARRPGGDDGQATDTLKSSSNGSAPQRVVDGKMRSAFNVGVVGLLVALFALCLGLVAHLDGALPTPRGADIPADEYSEARARVHLESIVGFGVRTVGSVANEVTTIEYLLEEVAKLSKEADEVQAANDVDEAAGATTPKSAQHHLHPPPLKVLVDVHRPSGAFSSDFLEGFTNVYHNVSNVVVLIEGSAPRSEQRSVLVNAHFDCALGTPAASDDAVMVASMLEVMRNVIHGPRLEHSVVFNMNGGEETNWMAVSTLGHVYARACVRVCVRCAYVVCLCGFGG